MNVFKLKTNYLPGDISEPHASAFGLPTRGIYAGMGDGNGKMESSEDENSNQNDGIQQEMGENPTFWVDLSTMGLIDGLFNTASPKLFSITGMNADLWFPKAKIGGGNYIVIWSANSYGGHPSIMYPKSTNFFAIVAPDKTWINPINAGMNVMQAYTIDSKIDDGLPQSGSVLALYNSYYGTASFSNGRGWAIGNASMSQRSGAYDVTTGGPTTNATASSQYTCYDNGNIAGTTQTYSIGTNSGNGINCALSFKFK